VFGCLDIFCDDVVVSGDMSYRTHGDIVRGLQVTFWHGFAHSRFKCATSQQEHSAAIFSHPELLVVNVIPLSSSLAFLAACTNQRVCVWKLFTMMYQLRGNGPGPHLDPVRRRLGAAQHSTPARPRQLVCTTTKMSVMKSRKLAVSHCDSGGNEGSSLSLPTLWERTAWLNALPLLLATPSPCKPPPP
jgi:hypothetical protein